ncbi:hypothetical protein RchiOBHm_Chr6g0271591 [Rosa chinensis]|uniref:Uncharacterized protein n=1 Tax=Rosa chinensis TaxID=74649 RepID=A0A2P6PR09_ROSCH|nr:hypothetical protein RchiOBHm_Chr6g0271591 [Rosa chinensis]
MIFRENKRRFKKVTFLKLSWRVLRDLQYSERLKTYLDTFLEFHTPSLAETKKINQKIIMHNAKIISLESKC